MVKGPESVTTGPPPSTPSSWSCWQQQRPARHVWAHSHSPPHAWHSFPKVGTRESGHGAVGAASSFLPAGAGGSATGGWAARQGLPSAALCCSSPLLRSCSQRRRPGQAGAEESEVHADPRAPAHTSLFPWDALGRRLWQELAPSCGPLAVKQAKPGPAWPSISGCGLGPVLRLSLRGRVRSAGPTEIKTSTRPR